MKKANKTVFAQNVENKCPFAFGRVFFEGIKRVRLYMQLSTCLYHLLMAAKNGGFKMFNMLL